MDFGSLCSIPLHEALTAPNFRNFGFWISDFGFGVLDFGFWILEPYVAILLVQILNFGFWILGPYVAILLVQILDFGFRILDFEGSGDVPLGNSVTVP